MSYEAGQRAAARSERLRKAAFEPEYQLAALLSRTARALETSAALAEEHALKHEQAGRDRAATRERLVSHRASDAAGRARLRAKEALQRRESPGREGADQPEL